MCQLTYIFNTTVLPLTIFGGLDGKLIVGVAVLILGAIFSFFEKKLSNNKEGKSNLWNSLSLILVVGGAIVSCWSGCDENLNKITAQVKSDSLFNISNQKQTTIDSITKVLNKKQDTLADLQRTILDSNNILLKRSLALSTLQSENLSTTNTILIKNGQLSKSQDTVLKNITKLYGEYTGGGNIPRIYATAVLLHPSDSFYSVSFWILNASQYPISGITILIDEQTFQVGEMASINSRFIYSKQIPFPKYRGDFTNIVEVQWRYGAYDAIFNFQFDILNPPTFIQPKMKLNGLQGKAPPTNWLSPEYWLK